MDYRWAWVFGAIDGRYNQIRANEIVPKTKKTPRELAKLCFEQMGVSRFKVEALPDDLFPEINWKEANPAQALEDLCAQHGCVICPRYDGSVMFAVLDKALIYQRW